MSRDALVVGINTYTHLPPLTAAAKDAEAIAQLLMQKGEFNAGRLPEIAQGGVVQVGQRTPVTVSQLEEAIVRLFKPEGQQIPDTALFYFSGHGLRKTRGISEGYLATSDVDPESGKWGVSLQWLRRVLEESPIRQQIIWLDCCHAGELLNLAESDPGDRGAGKNRCFIAAARDFETAWQDINSPYSVLTQALLEGLDPDRTGDRGVTNYGLVDFLNQRLQGATQRPIFTNFGEAIQLTRQWQAPDRPVHPSADICPYKGLRYFDWNNEDPKYFYGRSALTSQLLDQVRQSNFVAIVGASGSGKSSVLRAGLLHQLSLGQRLSGSDRWQIRVMVPGDQPMQALAQAFVAEDVSPVERAQQLGIAEALLNEGADGLRRLVETAAAERLVLVVDQFEEVFTLCADNAQRQRFFHCLLQGLERSPKLCVIVAMRADFFGKCLEQQYSGLAKRIEPHLVTVTPMSRAELQEAIAKPAAQVNLGIEPQLAEQMMADVMGAPGSLPLLQYTLTELWKQRSAAGLQLRQYSELGGIIGALQKRATAVYESFAAEERSTVQHIFLALTQLGEGTEDTRRRVVLADLVSGQHSEAIVQRVVQKLADEKLIVTSERVAKGSGLSNGEPQRVAVVDVAHEALIRHWELLRSWLEVRRDRLRQVRRWEERAIEWRDGGKKPEDLLQGRAIGEALRFQKEQAGDDSLNALVEELIGRSVKQRRNNRLKFVGLALVVPLGLAIYSGIQIERSVRISRYWEIVNQASGQRDNPARIAALQALVQAGEPLTNIRLAEAHLIRADLSRANLSRANLFTANLITANLSSANLSSANLIGANLNRANLFNADLSSAKPIGANLSGAKLFNADLSSANLSGANLSSAILLSTNLLETKNLSQQQLEGEDSPLLCNVALPPPLKQSVNPDRDCDRLPQVLLERYSDNFKTLEEAKDYVNEARKRKWD
jgi:energy-coupling factor transporter ATP-binding protein EcfA2